MATETQFARTESLPPAYLQQFFAGVPGANIPGILPLLNQELVNRILGMGVEGATPYTYTGQRIAEFTPAEEQAFRLAGESAGGYMPYIRRAEQLGEQGLTDVRRASDIGTRYLQQAGREGAGAVREAADILRTVPQIATAGTVEGQRAIRGGLGALGEAQNLASSAGISLGEAQNILRGATAQDDLSRAQALTLGAAPNLGQARREITGARPQFGQARGALGQAGLSGLLSTQAYQPSRAAAFYNPFEEAVVQQTLQDIGEQYGRADIGERARQVASGAFGGSRGRLAQEDIARQFGRGATEAISGIRAAGYGSAQQQAQQAFEAQQARQANLAGLQAQLGSQYGSLAGQEAQTALQRGQALGGLGLSEAEQARARAQQYGALGTQRAGTELARGQALSQSALSEQQARLNQASALSNMAGQGAGMGAQLAGLGTNLAGVYGNVAGGLGSLGTGLSNILGGVGRDISTTGLQLGQYGANIGQQMAGLGQGVSGLVGQDINTLLGIGGMQRGQQQAGLDLAYQNFLGQYNLPMQTFGQIGQLAAGFAPALGGQTVTQAATSTPSNTLMQGLGAAATLYGLTQNPASLV